MEQQHHCLTPAQRQLLLQSLQPHLRPEYSRRIQIMLLTDEGNSRAQICQKIGCAPETARYWMTIAQSGQAHRWHDHTIGRPKAVHSLYCNRLKELVSQHPHQHGYPFQRWTAKWLSQHLEKEFGIPISDRHINRLLKQMGLATRNRTAQPNREAKHPPCNVHRDISPSANLSIPAALHRSVRSIATATEPPSNLRSRSQTAANLTLASV